MSPTAQSFGRRVVRCRNLLSGAGICCRQWILLEHGQWAILAQHSAGGCRNAYFCQTPGPELKKDGLAKVVVSIWVACATQTAHFAPEV
eukprot:14153463-Alexandrium_andersonii.AAC.1